MIPDATHHIVERLGARGDGIAETDSGPLFIPFTLPGEHVSAVVEGDRGEVRSILNPSPERQVPICKHFGVCGGCALQHFKPDFYKAWKEQQIRSAFNKFEIESDVLPLVSVPLESRRRAQLAARRTKKTVVLGYREHRSHSIVDIGMCPVLSPNIVEALDGLREMLRPLLSRKGEARIAILETPIGLDVSVESELSEISHELRFQLSELARRAGLARLSIDQEIVYCVAEPRIKISGIDVGANPLTFLQAVEEAQDFLIERICRLVDGAKRVADLFSGIGTFTLPMARMAEVSAFENDRAALQVLSEAVNHAAGLKPVHGFQRDLFLEPLSVRELNVFDAVVFDPPRAGAALQAAELAQSSVPCVIAVSCNPDTLARDARRLIDGGYEMGQVYSVDQFVFSPHVELVVCFRRENQDPSSLSTNSGTISVACP